MPGHNRQDAERLSLIVETQREIASAGNDLQAVMQLVAERSQAITGADGAMVNLLEGGDQLHTRAGGAPPPPPPHPREYPPLHSTPAGRSPAPWPGTRSRVASRS